MAADKTTFQSKPVEQYPHRMTSEKVTIAAQPFQTDEETKEAFGKLNPWRYGVLPVLIVIRNDSAITLKVDRLKFSYVLPDRSQIDATPARDVKYLRGAQAPKNMPGVGVPGVRLGKGNKNPLDTWEIEGRAFAAGVIPPGESASGFVYFYTPDSSAASSVYINGLKNAAPGAELYYFEIPMSGN